MRLEKYVLNKIHGSGQQQNWCGSKPMYSRTILHICMSALLLSATPIAHAKNQLQEHAPQHTINSLSVRIYSTNANAHYLGKILIQRAAHGLKFIPQLSHLPPGYHGFHIHTHGSCKQHGLAAGGHWDPLHTGRHLGPYRAGGHKGDLPRLWVNKQGQAKVPVYRNAITLQGVAGHSLMIHAQGDNYSDKPQANGGGGARIACGVIPHITPSTLGTLSNVPHKPHSK